MIAQKYNAIQSFGLVLRNSYVRRATCMLGRFFRAAELVVIRGAICDACLRVESMHLRWVVSIQVQFLLLGKNFAEVVFKFISA